MLIHWFSHGCESISEHPINGRKCRAYWISRNGIKYLKAQNEKYLKAKDLYFDLLDMELGRTSDDTFETPKSTALVFKPSGQYRHENYVKYDSVEGTLAIISDVERESLAGRLLKMT